MTTVRPTTTALQAKFQASDLLNGNQLTHDLLQRPLTITVEGGRIVDRHAGASGQKQVSRW